MKMRMRDTLHGVSVKTKQPFSYRKMSFYGRTFSCMSRVTAEIGENEPLRGEREWEREVEKYEGAIVLYSSSIILF